MRFRLLLFCLPLWVSCQNTTPQAPALEPKNKVQKLLEAPEKPKESYTEIKAQTNGIKVAARATTNLSKQSDLFTEQLYQKLLPHWLGTPWSFEGHPEQPGKQPVACSYFVATVLRDAGVPLNRYKMAQLAPLEEAQLLSGDKPVIQLDFSSKEEGIQQLKTSVPQGIHFIGFNSIHVGFIYRKGNQLAFIHSYYKNNIGVLFDPIEESPLWKVCSTFYLYPLSENPDFIKLWLKE
ncbi:MAG: hypothetical protein RL607_147 [Bacteroidota bacterium]|jgi:hypothetical protein